MVYRQYAFFTGNSVDQNNVSFPIRGSPYVAAYKIHEVTIPLAFNTTDSSNNQIVFERNGSVKSATVPSASYTAATFPGALQTALNNVSTVKDFTVTFDENTRALTISAGSAFTIRPFAQGTSMYRQLGMTKYTAPAAGTSVTFGVSDFTNTAPLLLTSTQLNSKHMVFAETMSEEEDQPQLQAPEVEQEAPPAKKKRTISPEQKAKMMENLQKAREARAANRRNVTKYPLKKRERTMELYAADIEKKAEQKAHKLAEELLQKKEQEKELEEYRQWKQSQQEKAQEGEEEEEGKPSKEKKKATAKAKQVSAKPAAKRSTSSQSKATPTRKKKASQKPLSDSDEQNASSYSNNEDYGYCHSTAGWSIDDFLD
ncbi:hypothetical protein HDV00_000911 [Rhizophlyctis rosea]|nr:hypothetical protein HDV00_000911 [Rhizophlyctis rosea]